MKLILSYNIFIIPIREKNPQQGDTERFAALERWLERAKRFAERAQWFAEEAQRLAAEAAVRPPV
jgi:hypothetical protein